MTARTVKKMASPSRRFSGYGVVSRPDGPLIWGTLRPAQADAWAAYLHHNPTVDGFPPQAEVVAVEMTLRPVTD